MHENSCLTLIIVLGFNFLMETRGNEFCGDWETFKDEKCFKLLDNVTTHDGAIALCKKLAASATLASILSQEEQEFLENYVFKKKGTLNSVWIGAKRNPNNKDSFIWEDGNRFDYSNWDKDDIHEPGDDCSQFMPQKPFFAVSKFGKWEDVQCGGNKQNQVLCQFGQSWPLTKLVKTFLEFRKGFTDFSALTNRNQLNDKNLLQSLGIELNKQNQTLNTLHTDMNNANKNINDLNGKTQTLITNPVPLNFIYIQLPTQPEPTALWPGVKWEDVSATYAGLFFRVLGGSSEKFGTIQNETSPRLALVEMVQTPKAAARLQKLDIPANGAESAQVYVGSSPAVAAQALDDHLKFKLTTGEVRPRNHAVRVWKRTK